MFDGRNYRCVKAISLSAYKYLIIIIIIDTNNNDSIGLAVDRTHHIAPVTLKKII
jgi:hypothetical protein